MNITKQKLTHRHREQTGYLGEERWEKEQNGEGN